MLSSALIMELTKRLLVALVLSGSIGLQRAFAGKAAGVRTHILVGMGSALITITSAYAFPTLPGHVDPTRIAAQIVSGIGFIGGGMILKEGTTVRGLTTAASLWVVAGVGMAAGSGLAELATIATILILVTLGVLGQVDKLVPKQRQTIWSLSCTISDVNKLHDVYLALHAICPTIHLVGYDHPNQGTSAQVTFEIEAPRRFNIVQASHDLGAQGAVDLHWRADSYGEEMA